MDAYSIEQSLMEEDFSYWSKNIYTVRIPKW